MATIILAKTNGKCSFSREPAAVFQTLRNGLYTITITRAKEKRTLDQNALMWLWFTCIERETETIRQDVHDYYCAKFLRRTICWNGSDKTIVEGTSKLSKERMTWFLAQVQADAQTEFGISLPNPEDRYFEQFYETYR